MRAVLLAKATITSMGGLRSSIRESHGSPVDPFRMAQRTEALAPMINSRRRVRSPMRDVSPSFCLPPEERCSGVRPSHAAKSRPLLNVVAEGASAARAVAVIGPMPGMVINRLASASSLARRAISRSSTATRSIQGPQLRNEESQDRAGGFGDGAILFLNLRHQLGHVEEALRSHKSKLRKMAADCIDRLGPLANHEIADAEHHCRSLLLFAFCRYETHGRPQSSFTDRFSVSRIVFLTLHKWLDVSRSD